MKNIKYVEYKHNRTRSSLFMHTKFQVKRNCDEISKVGSSSSYSCENTSCHVARSTLVMLVANNVQTLRWPAISLDLNPYIDNSMDLLKGKVRAQRLRLNLREFTHVIPRMCAAIPQQYVHRHMLTMSTRFLAVDMTPGLCRKYWNEIKYDVSWFCRVCFKGVHVNHFI